MALPGLASFGLRPFGLAPFGLDLSENVFLCMFYKPCHFQPLKSSFSSHVKYLRPAQPVLFQPPVKHKSAKLTGHYP